MSKVKTYLKGSVKGDQIVGCTYKSDGSAGTSARVSFDKTWLHIITDDYEGSAMLHIECLPKLRTALARIAKEMKAVSDAAPEQPSQEKP